MRKIKPFDLSKIISQKPGVLKHVYGINPFVNISKLI